MLKLETVIRESPDRFTGQISIDLDFSPLAEIKCSFVDASTGCITAVMMAAEVNG